MGFPRLRWKTGRKNRGLEDCARLQRTGGRNGAARRRANDVWRSGELAQPGPVMPIAAAMGAAGWDWEACPRPSLRSERVTPVRHERERRMFGVVDSLFNWNQSGSSLQRWARLVRVGRLVHAHRFQHEVVARDGLVLCALSVPHCLLWHTTPQITAKRPCAALTGGGTARGACLLRFSVRSWARWAVLPTRKTGSSYGGNDSR